MKLLTLVLLVGVLSGPVGAADSTPDAQATEPDQGRHFLWRIMGSNGTEVFLLGSIHALPKDAYPLAAEINDAFALAHSVLFEVDMKDTSALGGQMMAAGALPPERRLGDVLDPETRRLLDTYLEESGLSFGAFEAMKPWMAALALTSIELMKAGFSADAGLDLHLAQRARRQGKTIEAFETADYQIGLFSDMDEDESGAFLRYTLKDIDTVVSQLGSLTEAWKNGDIETLQALLTEAFADEPKLFERLVTVRNLAWLPRVEDLLKGDGTAMVVVGALHLVGPGGLIELLRERGYRVEQL
ncbi:MAG: TraB/GumN family protein [Acidobacteria bacterium]|nr:MAG: TraB/GumN family protein [Acidobacteriota bacterium]